MTEFPWFKFYPAEFRSATMHLSFEARGIYMELIMQLWDAPDNRLPNDDVWLANKLQVSRKDIAQKVRPIISEFCKIQRKWITQKRVTAEHLSAEERRGSAKKAAKARHSKDKIPETAYAQETHGAYAQETPGAYAYKSKSKRRKKEDSNRLESNSPEAARENGEASDPMGEIVKAFTEERIAVFGEVRGGRKRAADSDWFEAERWLAQGATPDLCRSVFRSVFKAHKADADPPSALRYMTGQITKAIADPPPPPAPPFDPSAPRKPYEDKWTRLEKARTRDYWTAIDAGTPPLWLADWGDLPERPEATEDPESP